MENPKEVALSWGHYQSLVELERENSSLKEEMRKLQSSIVKGADVIVCELPIDPFNNIPVSRRFCILTEEQWSGVVNKSQFKRIEKK
jgi:hypothetical protein